MENIILIRIGEIFLKGNNKGFFVGLLKKNIAEALLDIECKLTVSQNRMFVVGFNQGETDAIVKRLTKVFGIYSVSKAVKLKTDLEKIIEACVKHFPKEGTFRATVNRADKRIALTSMEMAREIGAGLLRSSDKLKVDLFKFDFEVNVDIREDGYSYIFYDRIPCAGGLPVGCAGDGMLLLSGGIDSPVAGFMLAKRGVKVHCVHFHSFPYTGEQAKQKVLTLAKILSPYLGAVEISVVHFTKIQTAIKDACPIDYMITIMRKFMMRISTALAKKKGCGCLVTGESLGQVASQTMESIFVTNSVTDLPVFRPLIGMDKEEIIDIAQRIGTFETSVLPFEDCCTVFLPKNPVIKPRLEQSQKYEERMDVEGLVKEALETVETIIVKA